MTEPQEIVTGLEDLFDRIESMGATPDLDDDRQERRERLVESLSSMAGKSPIRAAVGKLSADQSTLLVELLAGFEDRRAFIEWQQDLAIHSLGQLDDDWFTRAAFHAPTVSAMLDRPWGSSAGFEATTALEIRRSYAAKFVLPAFHDAIETFRWAAVERTEHLDEESEKDYEPIEEPANQEFPAMRPELGELDQRQEWALGALLDGFNDVESLLVWSHQVTSASYAEIDSATISRAYFEQPIREYLTAPSDDPRARFMRESWAAKYLLPSFNRAAAALAERATEVAASAGQRIDDDTTGSIS